MFEQIYTYIISSVFTLLVALLLARISRMEKKQDERHKQNIDREVLMCTHRHDESVLLLEVVRAVRDKKSNGELEDAQKLYIKTNREYEDFVRKQASAKLAENNR